MKFLIPSEAWKDYVEGQPSIFVLSEISTGIADMLSEGQGHIKAVLDSSSQLQSKGIHAELKGRIEELKSKIPAPETSSGYVPRSRVVSVSDTHVSGDTVYLNNHYYDSRTYTVFAAKEKSSSPSLVRSVQAIAHNATLEDIDQRIAALQQIIHTWSIRTKRLSSNGTEGLMRSANEAYLEGLKEFTAEFLSIRKRMEDFEQQQQAVKEDRVEILAAWKKFEDTRIDLLKDYFEKNAIAVVEPEPDGSFILPNPKHFALVYSCEISGRTLFFHLSETPSGQHPFVLVDVSAPGQEPIR